MLLMQLVKVRSFGWVLRHDSCPYRVNLDTEVDRHGGEIMGKHTVR